MGRRNVNEERREKVGKEKQEKEANGKKRGKKKRSVLALPRREEKGRSERVGGRVKGSVWCVIHSRVLD